MGLPKYWEYIFVSLLAIYYGYYQWTIGVPKDFQDRLKVLPDDFVRSQPVLDKKFAYVQYATDLTYLQLSLDNLISIDEPRGDLVVIYNEKLQDLREFTQIHRRAQSNGIILKPVSLLTNNEVNIWHESFTKLHIFNLDYDRIIYFDADSMLLNVHNLTNKPTNMNELFNIPWEIDIAMPQAYWLSDQQLTRKYPVEPRSLLSTKHKFENRRTFFASHVIVLKPNKGIFQKLLNYVYNPWWWVITQRSKLRKSNDFDMEVLNKFIDDNLHSGGFRFGVIDHRIYGVLTGEFKEQWHSKFLCDPELLPFINHRSNDGWNAFEVLEKIKLIHFSDEPIPKPWIAQDNLAHYNTFKIYCQSGDMQKYHQTYPVNKPRLVEDCDSVEIWNWIRQQFEVRINDRKD